MNPKIIFIVGPTCVGKSKLALKLAKKFQAEIINADSMQVYSNLKVLTARPTNSEMKLAKHHLYGFIDGSKRYNVGNWCSDVSNIFNNNSDTTYIVVGGTGMYIEKLINGLIQLPKIPESIKKESEILLLKEGKRKFIKRIDKIDSKSLNKISKNDTLRLRRIWEVYQHTNNTLSYWLNNQHKKFLNNSEYLIYLFMPKREEIYKKVNKRFLEMINNGAIDEVKRLYNLKLENSLPIMRAHGVPEITNYLLNKMTIDECINKSQQVTRNYVKRQFTWWRSTKLKIHQSFDEFPGEIDINLLNF